MGPRYVFGPDAPKWETPDPDDAAAIVAGLPFDPMNPPTPPHDLGRDWVSTSRWVISIAAAKTIAAEWDAEVRFADGHADAKRQAQAAREAYAAARREVIASVKARAIKRGKADVTNAEARKLEEARSRWFMWDDVTMLSESTPVSGWDGRRPLDRHTLEAAVAAAPLAEYLRLAAVAYILGVHSRARKEHDMADPWGTARVSAWPVSEPWRKRHGDEKRAEWRANGEKAKADSMPYGGIHPTEEGPLDIWSREVLAPEVAAHYAERMEAARRGA